MNSLLDKNRDSFPILQTHPTLVYLDNASTTQTPQIVLDKMNNYYTTYRSNIHRGIYDLSVKATEEYENARKKIAQFINAEPEEIIFTSGTTHGLNLLAYCLNYSHLENVLLTRFEHHANLIPWQQISKFTSAELRFIELTKEYEIDLKSAKKLFLEKTKLLSFSAISNTLGTISPIQELIKLAKDSGATTIIDAAQLSAHQKIDVKKLDCDFLVFSGHKMYGPTGTGVLYGKKEKLAELEPFFYGGDMVREVSYESATWQESPMKFEAGTPNIAGAIGLGAAIDFMESIGWEEIQKHEQELLNYFFEKKLDYLNIIGPNSPTDRGPVISFTINGVHPHDIAEILNRNTIAVRAGHHCAMPLMKQLGISGTVRVSFGIYNTIEDIDKLFDGLEKVKKIFKL
jgi:cysteine desulfurase/selenocysteine lyase